MQPPNVPPNVPLEFEETFSSGEVLPDEQDNDFVKEAIKVAQYERLGINTTKLSQETAIIDAHCKKIYDPIAAKVTGATSRPSLAKNAPASAAKKVREEITKYASGGEVVAEFDANNVCIRTYSR